MIEDGQGRPLTTGHEQDLKDDDDGMLADLWIESVQAEAQQVQRPVGHFRSLAFIGIDVGTVEKFWQNMTRYNVL